jgi:hypothetical protein
MNNTILPDLAGPASDPSPAAASGLPASPQRATALPAASPPSRPPEDDPARLFAQAPGEFDRAFEACSADLELGPQRRSASAGIQNCAPCSVPLAISTFSISLARSLVTDHQSPFTVARPLRMRHQISTASAKRSDDGDSPQYLRWQPRLLIAAAENSIFGHLWSSLVIFGNLGSSLHRKNALPR